MHKLARATSEQYTVGDGKAGYVFCLHISVLPSDLSSRTFVHAWQSTMKIHEIIGDNRIKFAHRLNEMSEELNALSKEVDKNRKNTKELATRYERALMESETTTEKSKVKVESTAEELERILLTKEGETLKDGGLQKNGVPSGGKRAIGKAVAKGGMMLMKGKNPANVGAQQ